MSRALGLPEPLKHLSFLRKAVLVRRLEIRRAVIGDEGVLRDLRIEALTDSPEALGSTLERELARTIEDWRKWMAPGVTFPLLAGDKPRGLVAGVSDALDHTGVRDEQSPQERSSRVVAGLAAAVII